MILNKIKLFVWIVLPVLVLLVGCKHNSTQIHFYDRPETVNYFQIKRGINISHWLSQNPDKGDDRKRVFTNEDAVIIANLGYDHVRIPVDEEHLWDDDGNRLESSFKMLHEGIYWCLENDLKIIIDLHQIRSHTFNSKSNLLWTSPKAQLNFINIWKLLSNELSQYSNDKVAYELLNEVVADSSSQWNELLNSTIDSIRKYEPNRKIIIGSNRWQSPDTFSELVVPENDSNIILSFHFYAPHAFTHYRAPWMTSGKYKGDIKYPGQVIEGSALIGYPDSIVQPLQESNGYYTKDSLLKMMMEPIHFAKKHKLQLYCGEFGVMPTVRRGDRLTWYTDVRTLFDENNIAWSNWDYKGLFGIYYPNGQIDEYLVKALIPE